MSSIKQFAVLWWYETRDISSTLLDVLPYYHRFVGAEAVIRGKKARVLEICGGLIYFTT